MPRRTVLLALAASLLAPVAVPARADGEVEIKCATVAPEGSSWMETLEDMNKEVYRKTRGRVRFKFFPGGIAGEEKAVLEKMAYDQLQAGGFTGTGLGEILPATRALWVPLLYRDYAEYDLVLSRLAPEFEPLFREKGYTVLGWAEAGFAHFYSRTPIRTVEEFRSAKCWVRSGDPLLETAIRELGGSPVPLPLSDVLTSLQTGLVDTVYISPLAAIALQWFPHLRHVVDVPIFNIPAALLVKNSTFDALSEADRMVVREVVAKRIGGLVAGTREDNAESERVLAEKGIETVVWDDAEKAKLDEIRGRIVAALAGKLIDSEVLERVEGILAEARAGGGSGR